MKILMIYCTQFTFTPSIKNLEWVDDHTESRMFENVQVAFIQVEEHDQDNQTSTAKKLLNFIKWVARKNDCNKIILHSFAHLSESKADPEYTKELFNRVEERLQNSDFETCQTPFGYFLDLNIQAPGFSMARVFKSF